MKIIGIFGEEARKKGIAIISKEITVEIFLNLVFDQDVDAQEAKRTPK